MEELQKGAITRTALGRFGLIGELYDARTESLSSRSLFKSSLPANAIGCQDLGRMEFDYKFTENISDCFDLIKVEAELQVGVLCGLITLDGSGKFLSDQRKSEKTVSCSLICKLQTVCQKFYAAWNEILQHVDLSALEDCKNTHVVVECYWGANCLLSLETFCKSESEMQEMKGCLGAELRNLGKLITAKVGGEFKKVNESLLAKKDFKIKVNADVVPENGWPTSVEDFFEFMKEVPKLLKKLNGGKGKPLSYVMIPLSTIQKLAKVDCAFDNLVVQIGESFLLSTVYFFDEIAVVKRKFYDHLSEIDRYKKYVSTENYQKSKTELKNLLVKESTLKEIIASNWGLVRSGAAPLKDLIRNVEKFKNQLNIIGYESYLDSCQEIHDKLSSIKNFLSKGIIYLGIGETFTELIAQDPSSEFILLLTSAETRESELYQNTFYYFLTLAEDPRSNTKYVVVDLDYGTTLLDNRIRPPKCVHLKGSQILSQDLYEEYVCDLATNLARPQEGSNLEYITHKPGNRVPLEMVCPNFQNNICTSEVVEWTCYQCRNVIEYGFDNYFYCSCGGCSCSSFTFQCRNPKHGNFFVAPKGKFLDEMLSMLRPFKEMNILILGQSGVGKSTWINSIVNYLNYDTLEDAEKKGVICTIPTSFIRYDPQTSTKHTVCVGNKSDHENTKIGNSATQRSHTYSFLWDDRFVRLIDTPGLGDTRGIAQDKENLMNVINHIRNFKELHGICILLKSDENRLTGFFSYCLKELLVNLHRSVTRNIVFCFTNARNTFYTPGQVYVILENIIQDLGIKQELALGRHNMFCLDNEAFLFLCSLKHPEIHYDEHLKGSFFESWKISLKETKRLFESIKSFRPHALQETMTLFNARNRILSLTQPLAEVSKTIQVNVALVERKQKEIEYSKQTQEELSKMLTITEIQLEPESLPYPRTVCTRPSCVGYVPYRSLKMTEIEYRTHCHERCYLDHVEVKTVNNYRLKDCTAMRNGICTVCGCGWEYHMHIRISQKRVEKQIKNVEIEKDIMEKESMRKATEDFVEKLRSTVEEYKKEQEFIIQATVKFGMFLKQNAITVYNDSMASYLEYLIKEEENKPCKSESEYKLLESMKDTLARYKEEVKVFEDVLNKATQTDNLTVTDVHNLEQELYKLKLTGEWIRKAADMSRNTATKMSYYQETPIQIKMQKSNASISGKIYETGKHFLKTAKTIKNAIFSSTTPKL